MPSCYYSVVVLSATCFFNVLAGSIGEPVRGDKVTYSRTLYKSPSFGGGSGDPFDDIQFFNSPGLSPISAVHSLNISSTSFYIDSIQVAYLLANLSYCQTPIQGISKNPRNITLNSTEHIVSVAGSTNGLAITDLTISTLDSDNKGNTYGPFGRASGTEFSFQGYIAGFYGRSESFLTNIGVYYFNELKKTPEFGNAFGGNRFDEHSDVSVPPIIGISTLTLWYGDGLNGIRAEYVLLGGNKILGDMHGNQNSALSTTITLKEGDMINNATFGQMQSYGPISNLNLTVKRASGGTEVMGPYGTKGGHQYNVEGNILGFHGHSGPNINKIGFYYA